MTLSELRSQIDKQIQQCHADIDTELIRIGVDSSQCETGIAIALERLVTSTLLAGNAEIDRANRNDS